MNMINGNEEEDECVTDSESTSMIKNQIQHTGMRPPPTSMIA